MRTPTHPRTVLRVGAILITLSWIMSPTRVMAEAQGNAGTTDTLRLRALFARCEQLTDNPDSVIALAGRAVELARAMGRWREVGRASLLLGDALSQRTKGWSVVQRYMAAADAYHQAKDTVNEAHALETAGLYYGQTLYDFTRSIDAYQKADLLWIALKDSAGLANNLADLGDQLHFTPAGDKAIAYMEKALAMHQALHDTDGIKTDHSSISRAYSYAGNTAKAREHANESFRLAELTHDTYRLAISEFLLGKIDVDAGHYVEGARMIEAFLALHDSIGDGPHNKGIGLWYLSRAYAGLGMPARALEALDTAVAIGTRTEDLNLAQTVFREKSALLERMGRYQEALIMDHRYDSVYEKIVSGEKTNEIVRKEMRFDFDKQQLVDSLNYARERQVSALRLQRQRTIAYSGIIGSVVLASLLLLLYRQRNRIALERKRSDDLLLNILPEETAHELKTSGSSKARSYHMVTVMFTDFKNFTQASERMTPEELVREIDLLYRAFDGIIDRHGVEKIKTIGDSYMCAGGLPHANTTNPVDVTAAALEIRDFMRAHRADREAAGLPWFDIRIGAHTGPVVAGIVGVKKFAYDIWGDTVNTASRMESSGALGMVNISADTYALVRHAFRCTHRGMIPAKNKGELHMYAVEERLRP